MMDEGRWTGEAVFLCRYCEKKRHLGGTNRLIPKKSEILVENWG
jgi:hypothetical protein